MKQKIEFKFVLFFMVQTLPTFCGPRSYEITPGGEGIFFENFVVNLS